MNLENLTSYSKFKSTTLQQKGTTFYMSPEMLEIITKPGNIRISLIEINEFGRLSDQFSLGLVIFDAFLVLVMGIEYESIEHNEQYISKKLGEIAKMNPNCESVLSTLLKCHAS